MSYNFLIDKHYCGKPKTDIILVVVKENLLNIILKIKKFREKMQKESMVQKRVKRRLHLVMLKLI